MRVERIVDLLAVLVLVGGVLRYSLYQVKLWRESFAFLHFLPVNNLEIISP